MTKSDLLFLVVLLTLPIQLGKHFFFSYSYIFGLPIDYRALTIYASDIAIVAYLTFFLFENRKKLKSFFKAYRQPALAIAGLDFYLLAQSLIFASPASIIFSIKTTLFSLLALCAAHTLSKKSTSGAAFFVFKITLVTEALILIAEFIRQKSLHLAIFGERTFDATTTSIAHANLFGNQFLRSYGTFPHPNAAAAFLVFGLILILGIEADRKRPNVSVFSLLVVLSGLAVTFSKSALATLAVALGIIFARKKGFIVLLIGVLALSILLLKNTSDSSLPTISERLLLIQKSLDISHASPLFGVGSNNFILELSKLNLFSVAQVRLLQPVHNIFFLILAEEGILGLLLFTALLFVVLKFVDTKIKIALFVSILIFGSIDHFLWTLQQGQLLLWLSLGYILSNVRGKLIDTGKHAN